MRYELEGSMAKLIDECLKGIKPRVFDLGFGIELKTYRLHGTDLEQFHRRLRTTVATTTAPKVAHDILSDVGVCDGMLIVEHPRGTAVYGSPYQFDMDPLWNDLEQMSNSASHLQSSTERFSLSIYGAAGQTDHAE